MTLREAYNAGVHAANTKFAAGLGPIGVPGRPLGIPRPHGPRSRYTLAEGSDIGTYYAEHPSGRLEMAEVPDRLLHQAVRGARVTARSRPSPLKDYETYPQGRLSDRGGLAQLTMAKTLEERPRANFSQWAAQQSDSALERALSNPHTVPRTAVNAVNRHGRLPVPAFWRR